VRNGDLEITFNSVKTAIFAFGRIMVLPEFEGCQPRFVRDYGDEEVGGSVSTSGHSDDERKSEEGKAKDSANKKTAVEGLENEKQQVSAGVDAVLETRGHDQESNESAADGQSDSGNSTYTNEKQGRQHEVLLAPISEHSIENQKDKVEKGDSEIFQSSKYAE
jgi:hypothetical protein